MKRLLTTLALLTTLSAATFAQSERDTTGTRKPLINAETKQKVDNAIGQADEKVQEEVQRSVRYQEANALPWFDQGTVFVGSSLGFGLGKSSGTYLTLNPRIGYFFSPGFMAGLKYGFDNRLATSFRARELSLFSRYYPFRTRINSFAGVGYNFGREFASNIGEDEKARYNSITLEAGIGFMIRRNLGGEVSVETNYYDRSNALAGRNRGGRFKVGINYYFNRKLDFDNLRRRGR
ncbi:MAG: hypothetical protein H7Z72_10675 [Bacteroidetes bacterium]|nr:hypothetical protein [Fibrella sp.]